MVLKEWFFSICVFLMVGCMMRLVLPSNNTSKMVNFCFSIFLLAAMFSGLTFKDFDFFNNFSNLNSFDDFDDFDDVKVRLEELQKEKTLGEIEKILTQQIKQDLLANKIIPSKILININMSDESSILINKLEIFMKEGEGFDECDKNKIKKIMSQKYGVEPDIRF